MFKVISMRVEMCLNSWWRSYRRFGLFAISSEATCVSERMRRNCVLTSRFCYPLYLHLYLTSIFVLHI